MKVLVCASCVDIRALHPDGKPTSCRCGEVIGWWVDPRRGTAQVFARRREYAWMIGLHNGFLTQALSHRGMGTPEGWRQLHDVICANASGYVFHKDQRNCWAAPFRPGWTDDVTWATEDDLAEQYRRLDSGIFGSA